MIEKFNTAKQALYNHVGFVEDWTVYPIDDRTEMYWEILDGKEVKFANTMDQFNSDDYFQNEIYKDRFYSKHVFRGAELTMIIVDTHTDGMKFFAFYINAKESHDKP